MFGKASLRLNPGLRNLATLNTLQALREPEENYHQKGAEEDAKLLTDAVGVIQDFMHKHVQSKSAAWKADMMEHYGKLEARRKRVVRKFLKGERKEMRRIVRLKEREDRRRKRYEEEDDDDDGVIMMIMMMLMTTRI